MRPTHHKTSMLFNSVEFLLFFPFAVLVHFMLPHGARKYSLLLLSYVFYMAWVTASLATNLRLFLTFKYLGFAAEATVSIAGYQRGMTTRKLTASAPQNSV